MTSELLQERTYTIKEFMALPDDGNRYELVEGRLITMSPVGDEHGRIGFRLISYLGAYLLQNPVGEGYTPDTAFVFDYNKRTVFCPDVSFVRNERLPLVSTDAVSVVPDFAVEIISPTDRLTQVRKKVEIYQQYGVKLVWVINPRPRRRFVEVYHLGNPEPVVFNSQAELDGGDLLPGFKVKVSQLLG